MTPIFPNRAGGVILRTNYSEEHAGGRCFAERKTKFSLENADNITSMQLMINE